MIGISSVNSTPAVNFVSKAAPAASAYSAQSFKEPQDTAEISPESIRLNSMPVETTLALQSALASHSADLSQSYAALSSGTSY